MVLGELTNMKHRHGNQLIHVHLQNRHRKRYVTWNLNNHRKTTNE